MSKATLTRFPGVHRRSDSGIYQFGLRAPADLLEHFPSGWAVRQSLGTAELRIANEKAKALQADWAQRFEAMRTGKPAHVDLASMRATLYARFEGLLEHVDEQYSGLVGDARHERAQELLWQLEDARAGAREGSVPDWAESWVNELGFPRSPLGDPYLESIDKVVALKFRDKLQEWAINNHKTANTADNILVSIRALVNVARDKGWIPGNPFERLAVKVGGKESEGREPWTHSELTVLFDDPIWTEGKFPDDRKAGGAAAYWIPLIACYTGARVTEIAQLWTDDLVITPGQEVIEFRSDLERDQKLKTRGSWRAVPMHSELVRLGLPEYVRCLPKGHLFPLLPVAGKNGAGGQFAQWFGNFKRAKGFDSPTKTLHSFRHLVATELRLAGATDPQTDAITGHVGEGIGRKVYAATIRRQAERMRPVIELLMYTGLKLKKI